MTKDDNELVQLNYHTQLSGADVKSIPDAVYCKNCRNPLVEVSRDPVQRKLSIRVNVRTPPMIVDKEHNLGVVVCDSCKHKNEIDLRLFGATGGRNFQ